MDIDSSKSCAILAKTSFIKGAFVRGIPELEHIPEQVTFSFAKRTIVHYILDILMHSLPVTSESQLIFPGTLLTKAAGLEKQRDRFSFPLRSSFLLCINKAIVNIHFFILFPFLSSRAFSSSAKNLDFLDLSQVFSIQLAYPGFYSMKRLGVFQLPLDGMLVHRRSLTRNLLGLPNNSPVPIYTPGWRKAP